MNPIVDVPFKIINSMKLLTIKVTKNKKYVINLEKTLESKIIIATERLNSKEIKINDQVICSIKPTRVPPAINMTIKLNNKLINNVLQQPKNLPTK